MLTCIIIDDEQHCIQDLQNYISKLSNLRIMGTCTDPEEGYQMILKMKPDLVFLDIELGSINGLQLMKKLERFTHVIFCTAHDKYAVDSFELGVVDYLLKPIEFTRFVKSVDKAIMITNTETEGGLFIKAGARGKLLRLPLNEIDFVEAMSNYVFFYCGNKCVSAYMKFSKLEELLPARRFIRVHKSYIVAFKAIRSLHLNEITLINPIKEIPISGSYKDKLYERLKEIR